MTQVTQYGTARRSRRNRPVVERLGYEWILSNREMHSSSIGELDSGLFVGGRLLSIDYYMSLKQFIWLED